MTNKKRLRKIVTAINHNSLKLIDGIKNWYCYELTIQHLTWARNMQDGWLIHVYRGNEQIGTIDIDGNKNQVIFKDYK
jgi:hypothetical protein